MRILILLRDLELGGAQRQASLLAIHLQRRGHRVAIIAFYPEGPFLAILDAAGIPIHSPGKRGRWDLAGFVGRLAVLLRRERADWLYSFLAIPNLLALIVRVASPTTQLAWGIRSSALDWSQYHWSQGLAQRLQARLSWGAHRHICNSVAGLAHARDCGFPAARLRVVDNGIELDRFRVDPAAGAAQRQAWGIDSTTPLLGLIGRLDPIKGHDTLIQALTQPTLVPTVHCVMVGDGPLALHLQAMASAAGVAERCRWVGASTTMTAVYNAIDVLVLPSRSEGFPNVVGEAMACGTPCVVTAVGDAPRVVGDSGAVVAVDDAPALAAACQLVLDQRDTFGHAARQRVTTYFDVSTMVSATEAALDVTHPPTPSPPSPLPGCEADV